MPGMTIIMPPQANEKVIAHSHPHSTLAFTFDPFSASFERSGSDLVVTFEDGGQLRLAAFFAPGEGNDLPFFQLPDGAIVESASLLAVLAPRMDLSPAAGLAAAVAGSGLNDYAEGAGDLLGGLDRLGSLEGLVHTQTDARSALADIPAGRAFDLPEDAAGPGLSGGTEDPKDKSFGELYSARAVAYMTSGDFSGSLHFRLLGDNGKPLENPVGVSYAVTSAKGLVNVDAGSIIFNQETGVFSVKLTEKGESALHAALADAGNEKGKAANIYDYLTITAGKNTYTMQVVLNQSGDYKAEAEDERYAFGGKLVAEWHSETNGLGMGERILGDGDDEVFFEHKGANGAGFGNGVIDAGSGADRLHIAGGAEGVYTTDHTVIKAASGAICIHGGEYGVRTAAPEASVEKAGTEINAGAGTLVIGAEDADFACALSAYGGDNTLAAGTMTLAANAANGTAAGLHAAKGGENTLAATGPGRIAISADVEAGRSSQVFGAHASGAGAANTVEAGGSSVVVESDAWAGYALGLHASRNGVNTVTNASDVTIRSTNLAGEGTAPYSAYANAMEAAHGGFNQILNTEGRVGIINTTHGSAYNAMGMYAWFGGNNSVNGAGSLFVSSAAVKGDGPAVALSVDGGRDKDSANIVQGVRGDVTLAASTDTGVAVAMDAGFGYNEILQTGGRVGLTVATKGFSAFGMRIAAGTNLIDRAESVHLSVTGEGPRMPPQSHSLVGMDARDNGTNRISNVTNEVALTVAADAGNARAMYAYYNTDFGDGTAGVNSIENAPAITVAASSVSGEAYAMYAENSGQNIITGAADGSVVNIRGDIYATAGGVNSIELGRGNDVLNIDGDLAATSGSYQIRDDGTGIYTPYSSAGANTIAMGGGYDTLAVSGKLTGGNIIDMGEDDDVLAIDYSLMTQSVLDGGGGENDVLRFAVAGSPDAVKGIFGQAAGNAVKNFETLILDLENGGEDALSLDVLLARIADAEDTLSFANGIYIRGDENDSVTGLGGWKNTGETHTVTDGESNAVAYDVYRNDDCAVDVYVQQIIGSVTG